MVLSNVANSRLVIFDENKTEGAEPSEPKLESWAVPPPSRAKENDPKPERWCDVKVRKTPFICIAMFIAVHFEKIHIFLICISQMPQKSKYGHTVMAPPPAKPTFQPFVEEFDQPPTMWVTASTYFFFIFLVKNNIGSDDSGSLWLSVLLSFVVMHCLHAGVILVISERAFTVTIVNAHLNNSSTQFFMTLKGLWYANPSNIKSQIKHLYT